jgi:hypothetical protein
MKKGIMRNTIRAELSSDTYATALGITVRSPSPVLALCKKLVEVSTYAPETPLNAYRDGTLCLRVLGIGEAAGLSVASAGNGCPVFRSVKEGVIAPPIDCEREPVE